MIAPQRNMCDSKVMNFAKKLRSERARIGLSQADAARVLGVSKSAIEKWEYGTKEPAAIAQEGALARLADMRTSRQ